jgi:hypothetical protein
MKAIKLKKDGTPRKNNAGKNALPENMVMMGLGSISLDRLLLQSKELAKEVRFAGRQAARDKAKELLNNCLIK